MKNVWEKIEFFFDRLSDWFCYIGYDCGEKMQNSIWKIADLCDRLSDWAFNNWRKYD